ncbi:MAG: hypothetical protein PHO75_02215 [Candidatus Shapirobacteria bacterium]|nr:hypothetical protein [Candidatus Shapirobacteria bacterium]
MKTTDLTPKMSVKSAEEELAIIAITGEQALGQNLGGLQFFSNGFRRGYGNNAMICDENGLSLGAADFVNAPLQLWMNGHIKASDIDLSGSGYTKINIFKQDDIPTSVSIGDLWFDTNDGNKLYRAAIAGADQIVAGEWELVVSTTMSTFAQDAIPTSLAIGDLWYDTNDSNKPYRAASVGATTIASGQWEIVNDLRAADALLKAGSSQSLTGDILVGVSNIKIDGVNKRIAIYDDSANMIILLGYQAGGF